VLAGLSLQLNSESVIDLLICVRHEALVKIAMTNGQSVQSSICCSMLFYMAVALASRWRGVMSRRGWSAVPSTGWSLIKYMREEGVGSSVSFFFLRIEPKRPEVSSSKQPSNHKHQRVGSFVSNIGFLLHRHPAIEPVIISATRPLIPRVSLP
jgi:hypothetical protein